MVAVSIGISALVMAAAAGVGRAALRLAHIRTSRGDVPLFSMAAGLAVLMLVMFFAGIAGAFNPLFAWGVALVMPALFLRDTLFVLGGLASCLKRMGRPRGALAWLCIGAIIACFALNAVSAMAPPSETDAITMHLVTPREYVRAGRMVWLPDALDSPMVMGPHLLYTFVMLLSLRAEAAPALLHFMASALCLVWIWRFMRRFVGRRGAWAAAALFCTMPMITKVTIAPMVDMFLVLYVIAALAALCDFVLRAAPTSAVTAASFAALAAWTKYNGFVALAAILSVILLRAFFDLRRLAPYALAGFVAAAAVASPFLIRNWAWTGNPVAPTMSAVFGGPSWDEPGFEYRDAGDERYEALHHSPKNMLLAPWLLTVNARLASSGVSGTIAFAFLAFLPFTLLLRSRRRLFLHLAAYCTVAFVLAYWTSPRPRSRYFLAIMPVLSLYTGAVLQLFRKYSAPAAAIGRLVVALSVLFGTAVTGLYAHSFVKVVFGIDSRQEFLTRSTDLYAEFEWMNKDLPREAKVLVGATNDLYYLERRAMRLDTSHEAGRAVWGMGVDGSPSRALSRMREFGITHVFVKGNMVNTQSDIPFVRILGRLAGRGSLELVRAGRGLKGTRNPFAGQSEIAVALYRVDYERDLPE